MILLILQDKTVFRASQPEPQVIASAIAAIAYRITTIKLKSLSPLDATTIPWITMICTRPIFYLVPVIEALSVVVGIGQYPEEKIIRAA
jgi:NADH dehydrogenase (ubiquinone) flavoprotein 1